MKRSIRQVDQTAGGGSETLLVTPETSSSQVVATAPPLKLRIKQQQHQHQSIVQELTVGLYEAATDVRGMLHCLLHFSHQLRLVDLTPDECELIARQLKDLVRKESDNVIRTKAVELIGEICCLPSSNKSQCVEEIVDCLHKEGTKYCYV
jgi:hypothetical protein